MVLCLGPQERQQVGIDLVRPCGIGAVDFLCAPDDSCRLYRLVLYGNDLVILAVHDQARNIHLLEILGEIGFSEGPESFVGILEASLHAPEPELI